MKERPILFTGAMVRAIIAGHKTQTRRVVNPRNSGWYDGGMHPCAWSCLDLSTLSVKSEPAAGDGDRQVLCRVETRTPARFPGTGRLWSKHQVGERLWVREKWARVNVAQFTGEPQYVYPVCDTLTDYGGPWKPSIHMPRAASRITLEISDVRVERLQVISESDAIAEGIDSIAGAGWRNYLWHGDPDAPPAAVSGWSHQYSNYLTDPAGSYSSLWERINGPGSWASNPWVWVIEFRRVA